MSSPSPQHSLSTPTGRTPSPVLPTPSCSSSASDVTNQLRRELEQQIAEKEKQLQDSTSGIGKSVLARQISQLKERLQEMDRRQQATARVAAQKPSRRPQSPGSESSSDDLSPATLEKLRNLERDLTNYRGFQQLSPGLSGHRKDKLLGQRSAGLDPLPSPSTSTMLPPPHGHDSTSLLPLPPPPTGSTPTKRRSKVPNADRRNTDIEFATEIGQGLLVEVRKMQALLQEKEDQLKALEAQKADLERAAESMAKQLRQREENEEKLKEETWNLELAKQELTISVTELQQNLNKANAEQKRMAEAMDQLTTEIEQMRDREEKLSATIEAMKQRHEQDMAALRRHSAGLQREKSDYVKQIETLSSELAIAKAQSRIAKHSQSELKPTTAAEVRGGEEQTPNTGSAATKEGEGTPRTTPPPSPKQTPAARNQQLEVETLKTSLAHAHRMVNNLRSNLHKEKAEKLELKKLLTESQETIEQLRNDPRLWVDTGVTPEHTTSSSSSRGRRKTKRRAPVSKTRVARHAKSGAESHDDTSDVDNNTRRKRKDSRVTFENSSSEESEYDDEEDVAVFPSLSSELEGKKPADKSTRTATPAGSSLPRTLGDELSAAFSGKPEDGSKEQADSKSAPAAPVAVSVSTQTDEEPAVSKQEISVQTDELPTREISAQTEPEPSVAKQEVAVQTDSEPELSEHSIPNVNVAPVTSCDQSVQSIEVSKSDAETQCIQPSYLDQGVQSDNIALAHASVQCEPLLGVDVGVSANMDNPTAAKETNGAAAAGAFGLGALAAKAFGLWGSPSESEKPGSESSAQDKSVDNAVAKKTEEEHAPEDSAAHLEDLNKEPAEAEDNDEEEPKVYTKAQTEAMIAAAVAEALAKNQKSEPSSVPRESEDTKRHTCDLTSNMADVPRFEEQAESSSARASEESTPARPTSPPPAHLLSRVAPAQRSSIGSASTNVDKGKAPVVRSIRAPSSLTSISTSEPRGSVRSTALFDAASSRNDGDSNNHIANVTQTMIGEWLWKYTRKSVGGGLSEHRHRRFFWVHPYTRTLYWSTRAPGTQGSETKAKSALIEGVSVVPDYNQPPAPGVPNVSLLIQTSNRVIKLTASSLPRHNIWFESLTYLLARAGVNDGASAAKIPRSISSSGRPSMLQRSSIQRLFRSGSSSVDYSRRSNNTTDNNTSNNDDDDTEEDEPIEDVRMCCDGRHHVSKLARDHIHHRPYYRKRNIRQTTTTANGSPPIPQRQQ